MPELPAICRACGAVYGSGFVVENTRNATFTDCSASCPVCGGQGDIPSGVYDAIGNTLQIIASSAPSQHQLLRIIAILEKGRDRQADPEEVVAEIEKESPPLAATIRKLLVPRNAGEFYAFLGVLLVALTLVKPNISGESKMSSADCDS